MPAALYRTREDPSFILKGGQLRSGGAGIDIHLPFLEGIGGKIGGEASTETVLYINAKDVETQWFQPDDAYFAQALKGVAVRKELLHFRRPSVFMVTGVKIAESATIVTGSSHNTWQDTLASDAIIHSDDGDEGGTRRSYAATAINAQS